MSTFKIINASLNDLKEIFRTSSFNLVQSKEDKSEFREWFDLPDKKILFKIDELSLKMAIKKPQEVFKCLIFVTNKDGVPMALEDGTPVEMYSIRTLKDRKVVKF